MKRTPDEQSVIDASCRFINRLMDSWGDKRLASQNTDRDPAAVRRERDRYAEILFANADRIHKGTWTQAECDRLFQHMLEDPDV